MHQGKSSLCIVKQKQKSQGIARLFCNLNKCIKALMLMVCRSSSLSLKESIKCQETSSRSGTSPNSGNESFGWSFLPFTIFSQQVIFSLLQSVRPHLVMSLCDAQTSGPAEQPQPLSPPDQDLLHSPGVPGSQPPKSTASESGLRQYSQCRGTALYSSV